VDDAGEQVGDEVQGDVFSSCMMLMTGLRIVAVCSPSPP
jgi:hypothetical protein